MAADPVDPVELEALARNAALTRPRPGHADLVGMQKYGFDEARPILERASARETAARVALGRRRLARSSSRPPAPGSCPTWCGSAAAEAPAGSVPAPDDVARLDADPVRCLDPDAAKAMVAEIDQAHKDGDTLGGVVEVVVHGLPPGLGSHVHWDRRLDARLAGALMGIQAIKGVEVGDGFELAATPGSLAHDEIVSTAEGIRRASGRSGGTEGGMTTGEVLRVRAAMKPISTVPRALRTIDVATGEEAVAHHQRSDVCAVPAAGIVAEAMVALVLAEAVLEKFGGDSVAETRRNAEGYLDTLRSVHLVVTGRPRPHGSSSSAPMGAGKTTVGRAARRGLGRGVPRHRPGRRGGGRQPVAGHLRRRGRGSSSGRWSAPRSPTPSPPTTACSRWAGERCSTRRPARCWPATAWSSCGSASADAAQRVGLGVARPLLLGNVRGPDEAADRRAHAGLRVGSPRYVVDTDGLSPEQVAAAVGGVVVRHE